MTDFSIPTLETGRLVLRGFTQADFEPFCAFYADDTTARFVGGVEDRRAVWRRMAAYTGHWALRGYGMWAVAEKQTSAFVGYAGNWFPEGWPEPEIAYGLLKSAQGKGYAAEAAGRVLRHAYEELDWTTAISAIDVDNEASKNVARRLGAVSEGIRPVSDFTAEIFRHQSPQNYLNAR